MEFSERFNCYFLQLFSIMFSRVLVQKDAGLLRDLRIMAYFRQCFPSNLNITTIKELAHALASHPPYEIPISSIKIKHLHCQVGMIHWHEVCNIVFKRQSFQHMLHQYPFWYYTPFLLTFQRQKSISIILCSLFFFSAALFLRFHPLSVI